LQTALTPKPAGGETCRWDEVRRRVTRPSGNMTGPRLKIPWADQGG